MENLCWPQRIYENLKGHATDEERAEIVRDYEKQSTPEEKAAWAKKAINKLEQLIPDIETRKEIMTKCCCVELDELIEKLKKMYQEHNDLDKLLEQTYQNPFYVRPRREGNTIYFIKFPQQKEEYDQATEEAEKRAFYCHCEFAKGTIGEISITHCYCGAGWYKRIMEGILERPVKVDVNKSVMRGDEICEIAVYI